MQTNQMIEPNDFWNNYISHKVDFRIRNISTDY